MFQDDYKNELDKIKPDGFTKYRIKQKLLNEANYKDNKSVKFYLGKAVAAVVCICIIFTAGAVLGRHTAPTVNAPHTTLMKTPADYDKIYAALEGFKESFWDKLKDYTTGIGYKGSDEMLIVEEYSTNTNAAKPGTTADTGITDNSYSETTTQVKGVDEADIIKTDGKYIYILSHRDGEKRIKIVASGAAPKQLSDIVINQDVYTSNLYLNGDRLVVLCEINGKRETTALIYDISDPANPQKLQSCTQSGHLNTSRLIGNKLYLISNFYINTNQMVKSDTQSYIPYIKCGEYDAAVAPETVHIYNECKTPEYTVISAFNIKDGSLISTQSVLGGTETVYSSTDNIIVADNGYDKTQIARFKIQDGNIELKASAELNGRLLNQFSIDEYKEHFRFVLTETKVTEEGAVTNNGSTVTKIADTTTTVNSLIILNSDLKETGKITDIAPTERVYSVRFMGDTAYFVTFRETDPLFSVDVRNPNNPKIIGALKIPGFSNYLFPYGEGKLLGIGQDADENTGRVGNMKLSMFNISNPANVTEQDKTIIPALYSEALYNHKAVLADFNRNIIAFAANGTYRENSFFIYAYENGEFIKKLETEIQANSNICRGIYIGKTFYIVTDYSIEYYDISGFEKLGTLKLN